MAGSEGLIQSNSSYYNLIILPIMALIGGFTAVSISFKLHHSLFPKKHSDNDSKESIDSQVADWLAQSKLVGERVEELTKRTDELMEKVEAVETEIESSDESVMESKPYKRNSIKKTTFSRSALRLKKTKALKVKAEKKKAKGKSTAPEENTDEFEEIPDTCPFSRMIMEQRRAAAGGDTKGKSAAPKKKEIDLGDMSLINDLEQFYGNKLNEDTQAASEVQEVLPVPRADELAMKVLRNSNSLQPNMESLGVDEKELEAKTRMEQLDRMLKLLEENDEAFTKIPDGPKVSCRDSEDEEEYRFRVLEDDGSYSTMPVQTSFQNQMKLYGL